ncbi:ABC transporter substrate-binding protein, partial [Rhodovulum adriaticum]|uniref:ABC transporter substrate-binding protein n=1 Tax=Rhodovulum adriaticum TaxID=35804 RepID=UPI001F5BAB21
TSWVVAGTIKGYSEYLESDFSDEAWEKVGVKALDDLTVEYTLEKEAPYFGDMTTYSILFPVNADFLASKGAELGSSDTSGSTFGTTQPDSILYNGGYILSSFDEKSSVVIVKNNQYWDAENIHIEKVTEIYDDGSDPYSSKKGFENGTYSSMSMKPTWEDYEEIRSEYEEYVRPNLPNPTVFGLTFNFNRQVYDNSEYP